MNFTFLSLSKFHLVKYFKLNRRHNSFIKNNFNLFTFLFFKKELFFQKHNLRFYENNFCLYNISNLFLSLNNYKKFANFFLCKFSYFFLNFKFYKFNNFLFLNRNALYQCFGFNNKVVFFKKYTLDELFWNRFIILYENIFDKFDKNHFSLFNKFNITRKIHLAYDGHEEPYNFLFLSLLKNTKNYDSKDFKDFNIKYLKNFDFFRVKIKNNLYRFLLRDMFCLDNNYMYDFNFYNNFNSYNTMSFVYFNFFIMNNNIDDRFFDLNFNDIQSELNNNNINLLLDNKNIFVYNNHFPLVFNDKLSYFLFYSDKNRLFKLKFLKFYYFYISSFFEFLLKKSFFFKIDTNFYKKYKNFDRVEKIIHNLRNSKYSKVKLSRLFNFGEMVEIIWYSFEFKDLTLLSNWLLRMLKLVGLRKHKQFINIFIAVINSFSSIFLTTLNIKGFFFKVKGKIGLSGNAKKKKSKIRIGKIYTSSKLNKLVCHKFVSKTNCGVLGFTMIISF